MEDKIEILRKYISECNNIVFFGGAGVSTELEAKMDYIIKNMIIHLKKY